MLRIQFGVLAAVAMTLAACSGMYVPPSSGPVVSLRISTTFADGLNMPVRSYAVPDCSDYPGELIGRLRSTKEDEEFSDELQTIIRADETARISVLTVITLSGSLTDQGTLRAVARVCQPVIEFMPLEGRRYEIVHSISYPVCRLQVFQLTGPEGERKVEPSARLSSRCQNDRYP
jgi:hypothetical protein